MNKMLLNAEVKALQEGEFVVIASTGQTDRMGDNINPDGWYLTNYKKNPVIQWAHNHSIPAVAKAIKTWVEDKKLMIKGKFADTPFAQELRQLVEGGFLNATSVGFYPLVADTKGTIEMETKMYRRATEEEIKKSIYDNDLGIKFDKQELLEVSWVNVPALPQALVTARKEGLALMTKELENIEKKEQEEDTETEEIAKMAESIYKVQKSISSMESAISTLEELLKTSVKSITPEEEQRSQAPELVKKKRVKVSPELRQLRVAIKAIEQVIIKEKVKAQK